LQVSYSTLSSTIAYSTLLFLSSAFFHSFLHSFPTRRSSDLFIGSDKGNFLFNHSDINDIAFVGYSNPEREKYFDALEEANLLSEDRKSTRLNSSHVSISYAVFCLKKKKRQVIDKIIDTRKTK